MTGDPETILRKAFEAVAGGDSLSLMELLDRDALADRRSIQTRMAEAELERLRRREITPGEYQQSLSFLNVGSVEELRGLSTGDWLQRSLTALPPLSRREIKCVPLGHVLEPPDRAHVTFRLQWASDAPGEPLLRVGTLRRTPDGWRLIPDPLSDWVVPGLDNILFSDYPDPGLDFR